MDSIDPIKSAQLFLTARSSFDDLVPRDEFDDILSGIDEIKEEEAVVALYRALKNQNDKRLRETNFIAKKELAAISMEPGITHIEGARENTPSDDDGASETEKANSRSLLREADVETLESAVNDLETLLKDVSTQKQELQQEADLLLSALNEQVDNLSDLRYGKLDFMSTITESIQSLERIEVKLLEQMQSKSTEAGE